MVERVREGRREVVKEGAVALRGKCVVPEDVDCGRRVIREEERDTEGVGDNGRSEGQGETFLDPFLEVELDSDCTERTGSDCDLEKVGLSSSVLSRFSRL